VRARTGKNLTLVIGALLLITFLWQGLTFISANSPTYDEAIHLTAGYSYLAKRDFRLERQNPPLIKVLSALPVYFTYKLPFDPNPEQWRRGEDWLIGQDFLYRSPLPADQILAVSRIPNLFLGAILVILIGRWAYRLWGESAAAVGMALAALEPNLVAHSSLVTTDLGATLFTFLTLYLLWEYVIFPSGWLLAATGISLGLALVSKYSASLLYERYTKIWSYAVAGPA
jgi:predicted membrane-bound dolichyl-phosphate-mannose-protein mannosyltransferase